MKNIVLAYSGTGVNRKKAVRDNPGLLCDVLDREKYPKSEQVHRYIKGIGSDDSLIPGKDEYEQIYAKTFPEKVCAGYRFIAQYYQPGDKIFITGFSRGAALARSVAGMICEMGLTKEWDKKTVKAAYRAYIAEQAKGEAVEAFRQSNPCVDVEIDCLAVYDTVLAWKADGFHNFNISPKVKCFRHAISIDERRKDFNWLPAETSIEHTDSEQRLFPGAHSDVGGSYQHRGLAHRAFAWVTLEMVKCGLRMPPHYINLLEQPGIEEHVSDDEKSDSSQEVEHGARQQRFALSNPLDKQHYPEHSSIFRLRPKRSRQCFDSEDMTIDESVERRMEDEDREYVPHISGLFEEIRARRIQYEQKRVVAFAAQSGQIARQFGGAVSTTAGSETKEFARLWHTAWNKEQAPPFLGDKEIATRSKRGREHDLDGDNDSNDESDGKRVKR